METAPEQLDELRQRIFTEFPRTAPPSPENITSHPCDECFALRDDFAGVRWWAADSELIENSFGELALFSPEAYHYYLPAFLLRALDAFQPDSLVLQFCIFDLSPAETPTTNDWHRARMNQFTPEQNSILADFLECVLQDERFDSYHAEAEEALRKFRQVAK